MKRRLLFALFVGLVGSAIATSSNAVAQGKPSSVKPAATATKAKPVKPKAAKPAAVATKEPAEVAPAPIADVELGRMFRNRTWLWADGAAYFGPKGRFVAWSGKDDAASFASGSWRTAGKGRLCFVANWVSRTGKGEAETCFAHALKSGDLLQQREPDGEWYVFKHKEAQSDDEYQKLVAGDQASAEAKKIMEAVKVKGS